MSSMKIKKGDQVVVIAGKYKGSEGKVLTADPARQRVVVEGVNMIKKSNKVTHQGPRGAKQGGIVTKEAPIHVSNVMLVDPEDSKRTRAGYRQDDDGAKVRFSRRTGKDIS